MAFTEDQLQAELDNQGLRCIITKFDAAGGSATDVGVQNLNTSARKTGIVQVAQSNTASQAATAIITALT